MRVYLKLRWHLTVCKIAELRAVGGGFLRGATGAFQGSITTMPDPLTTAPMTTRVLVSLTARGEQVCRQSFVVH